MGLLSSIPATFRPQYSHPPRLTCFPRAKDAVSLCPDAQATLIEVTVVALSICLFEALPVSLNPERLVCCQILTS